MLTAELRFQPFGYEHASVRNEYRRPTCRQRACHYMHVRIAYASRCIETCSALPVIGPKVKCYVSDFTETERITVVLRQRCVQRTLAKSQRVYTAK